MLASTCINRLHQFFKSWTYTSIKFPKKKQLQMNKLCFKLYLGKNCFKFKLLLRRGSGWLYDVKSYRFLVESSTSDSCALVTWFTFINHDDPTKKIARSNLNHLLLSVVSILQVSHLLYVCIQSNCIFQLQTCFYLFYERLISSILEVT